jgi:hypothetical protein
MASEALLRLRCDLRQLADLPMPTVRQLAMAMLAELDAELLRPAGPAPAALRDIPVDALLAEIRRRLTQIRRTGKLCTKCQRSRVRAHGLCIGCYQRERRKLRRAA